MSGLVNFEVFLFAIFVFGVIQLCGGSTRPPVVLWPSGRNNKTVTSRAKITRGVTPQSSLYGASRLINGNCTCIPYYYCAENQVFSDGSGLIDIRQGWPCRSVWEVCCKNPNMTITPHPTSTPSPTQTESNPTTIGPTTTPGYTPQCGTLNPNGVHARILGFKQSETQFGEYPWQGAILEQSFIGGRWVFKFVCGASLIWPSVIVTAAHCVQGKEAGQLIIRMGEWDTQSELEFLPHQDVWGKEIVIHPSYYSGAYLNDIALVFLRNSVTLSPHIDTICLPFQSPRPSYDATTCWVTGWGKNSLGGQYQAILHEVEIPIIPKAICTLLLRNTSLGSKFNFHPSYLCAGGKQGEDSCVGDGGGPLVCPSVSNPWRYVLAGVTSWGIGCGAHATPGVYTDVSHFTSWIKSQISQRVPLFSPRIVEVDPTTKNASHNTRTFQPPQYL